MTERVILADCCEDWIIEWGGFYKSDRSFSCPECATEWKKTDTDTYRRGGGRILRVSGLRHAVAAPHRAAPRPAHRGVREGRARGAAHDPGRPHAAVPRDALGVFAAARLTRL